MICVFSSHLSQVDPFRIRNAKVLVITVKALGNEVVKNLVLAGIGSLTLVDDENVTEDDLGAQFLISRADIGKNVCKEPSSS